MKENNLPEPSFADSDGKPIGFTVEQVQAIIAADRAEVSKELESMTRMFHAACADLGQINEALGLDPDDGGAEPILDVIEELKVAADRAKRVQGVSEEQIQEVMFAVFDYASIADGIESATFERRDQQRAKMFAQDRKIRGMIRALLANAPQVPEGFVLVPEWPTEEMMRAWECAPYNENADDEFRGAYAAMLSAAPQPEQKEG